MSDSQPQQAGGGGGQQPQQLLRPDDILKLQSLPDDEKQKYRLIMQNFWNMVQQHPAGSPENVTARQKLSEWSVKFISRERQHRSKMKSQQQQGNQGQSSQGSPSGLPNPIPIKQEAPQALNRGVEVVAAAQQPQAQQSSNPAPARTQSTIDPAIMKHVSEFPIQLPPNGPMQGTPEYDAKLKDYRHGYLNMLVKQASFADSRRKIVTQIQERTNNGQPVTDEMMTMKARIEKEHAQMKEQVEKFRRLQKQWKDDRDAKQAQQLGQGQPSQQPSVQQPVSSAQPQLPQQQPQRQLSQGQINIQTPIKEEPQIKIEGGPGTQHLSHLQPQAPFNVPGNQQHAQAQQTSQMPLSLPQTQQQARPPPAPHSQSMPPNQAPQFAQQGQPQQNYQQQQQQQRPQINPMQANAHQHQHQNSNSPHPHSATSNPTGPVVPLSHQAAVTAANRSYTDTQKTPLAGQQGSQGNFGSREREQLNNPKMPIPRHLNVATPAAVHMGQARPTMSGPTNGAPGPMGQPVIPRPPPFQLEGEGDRVLSKRKLDELVRQVTGGTEEALTPEVEEGILQLADDFMDTVISSACMLAKVRDSPQLDIRDIQLILERNYNIRIPGYASDEVRTVRKIAPTPAHAAKISAVNAAKVMGGKADF